MTDYIVISRYRNKAQCQLLVALLAAKGKTCYDFCQLPPDPDNPHAPPDEQMKTAEAVRDFYHDSHYRYVFENDMAGLKSAQRVILLLPAGTSSHIEAGIAYGLRKPLILIGKPEK